MTDHFVLSHWNNASTVHTSFYPNQFLFTLCVAICLIGLSIWIGLLISIFQARFYPHKFTNIKRNVINAICRIISIFLTIHLTRVMTWEWAVSIYCLAFILSCLYRKRRATLVEYGYFIIAEILKIITAIIIMILLLSSIVVIFDRDVSIESYLHISVFLLTSFMFSPILATMFFRWNNEAYQNTISLKSVIFTFIGAFTILMILIAPEIMWSK